MLADHGVDQREVLEWDDAEKRMVVDRPFLHDLRRFGDGFLLAP